MSNRKPMIFARVEPELREQVKAEADLRFDGNESLVVRDAVRLYIRLRSRLGVGFDPTIEALTAGVQPAEKEPVAA